MLHLVSDTCRDRFATFANHGSGSADLLLGAGSGFDKVASLDTLNNLVLIDRYDCCLSVLDYLGLSAMLLLRELAMESLVILLALKLR